MADDTGRRLIRQAQREGRLGTLSPGALKCLDAADARELGAFLAQLAEWMS